ncbi:hypothetical protein C8R46DRAFT_1050191 [Mycena filopes]|nr:hypothetical protein C8R46DRAFT_1050191 [Mycena filopes]
MRTYREIHSWRAQRSAESVAYPAPLSLPSSTVAGIKGASAKCTGVALDCAVDARASIHVWKGQRCAEGSTYPILGPALAAQERCRRKIVWPWGAPARFFQAVHPVIFQTPTGFDFSTVLARQHIQLHTTQLPGRVKEEKKKRDESARDILVHGEPKSSRNSSIAKKTVVHQDDASEQLESLEEVEASTFEGKDGGLQLLGMSC